MELRQLGLDVVESKEPTSGPWGQQLRAARRVVIVDRHYFSTAAYQGARGMNFDKTKALISRLAIG